jgi:hypothetical protein
MLELFVSGAPLQCTRPPHSPGPKRKLNLGLGLVKALVSGWSRRCVFPQHSAREGWQHRPAAISRSHSLPRRHGPPWVWVSGGVA